MWRTTLLFDLLGALSLDGEALSAHSGDHVENQQMLVQDLFDNDATAIHKTKQLHLPR